ncbi:tRNA splicing endonuclease [Halarchaeum grantii]|uniref:tRNA-splicing endonuclease n=1 Tax=Halarchaeum grantii TaxID=1193105 RepID=A0A830EVP1_9EURY|nr:tRNA-intron lyase [Halarchaeum grantii]GGL29229.1 tRNA splicing endonuclease [Halarchaeum grantii]
MNGQLRGDRVVVGGDARQRFHDSRGYGVPREGNEIALSRVEAAHLLFRGDLDAVDGMGFREFLAAGDRGFSTRFLVYMDLRDRGFYLSPAREDWVDESGGADFVVYPRGKGPGDDEVAYRVRVVGERTDVPADELGDTVLAVVDEESELTYLETELVDPEGSTEYGFAEPAEGALLDDRVVVWDPPEALHRSAFYGQQLTGRASEVAAVQLSLVEAAYLAAEGDLVLPEHDAGVNALVERGREVERGRFDRRLRTYRELRDRGLVPKTGFKFGADFRTYADVEDVADLGHSEWLVRCLEPGHVFDPRDLALDVRLAHGVRKRMVFALAHRDDITWLAVSRLTP